MTGTWVSNFNLNTALYFEPIDVPTGLRCDSNADVRSALPEVVQRLTLGKRLLYIR
jgi:hypothetical protein